MQAKKNKNPKGFAAEKTTQSKFLFFLLTLNERRCVSYILIHDPAGETMLMNR
jgi:hypothetical protein